MKSRCYCDTTQTPVLFCYNPLSPRQYHEGIRLTSFTALHGCSSARHLRIEWSQTNGKLPSVCACARVRVCAVQFPIWRLRGTTHHFNSPMSLLYRRLVNLVNWLVRSRRWIYHGAACAAVSQVRQATKQTMFTPVRATYYQPISDKVFVRQETRAVKPGYVPRMAARHALYRISCQGVSLNAWPRLHYARLCRFTFLSVPR